MGVDPFWFPKISEVVRATSTLLEDSIQTGIYLKNLTEKNHIRIRLKIKTITGVKKNGRYKTININNKIT